VLSKNVTWSGIYSQGVTWGCSSSTQDARNITHGRVAGAMSYSDRREFSMINEEIVHKKMLFWHATWCPLIRGTTVPQIDLILSVITTRRRCGCPCRPLYSAVWRCLRVAWYSFCQRPRVRRFLIRWRKPNVLAGRLVALYDIFNYFRRFSLLHFSLKCTPW
jgi:hypothetical protein